jgi:hypothetical protein
MRMRGLRGFAQTVRRHRPRVIASVNSPEPGWRDTPGTADSGPEHAPARQSGCSSAPLQAGYGAYRIEAPTSSPLIFGFDPAVGLAPTNTFHVGFWFNKPAGANNCVHLITPFNGEHKAGPLAFITRPDATTQLGPLCVLTPTPRTCPQPATPNSSAEELSGGRVVEHAATSGREPLDAVSRARGTPRAPVARPRRRRRLNTWVLDTHISLRVGCEFSKGSPSPVNLA